MRVIKFVKKYINYIFIAVSIFIAGTLVGSYVTTHKNNVAIFLIYQRTNISIALLTGILSGTIVGAYFDIKQKLIETQEYVRILVNHLILIRRGIDDYINDKGQSLLDEYLIKSSILNIGFEKYKKYMDKKIILLIKNALDSKSNSELAYSHIVNYTNAVDKLLKKNETKKNTELSFESKELIKTQTNSYIDSYNAKILEEKNILLDNQKKIHELTLEIHEKSIKT